ncbi:MAG: lytic transglycosylase domain-containing protein, partial [Sphingomonadales bacterium]
MRTLLLAATALIAIPALAHADDGPAPGVTAPNPPVRDGDGIPDQLDAAQRAGYRTVFASIRQEKWQDAQLQLESMKPGPLHAIARAELYTVKNSPKVELAPLMALLAEAPELPQAEQIARMAKTRGAIDTPSLPQAQRLVWYDGAPVRQRARTVSSDNAATEIALAIQPYVKADDGVQAEALVDRLGANLTPDSATEWQQKVAWIYYVSGDDNNARRVAARAQQG